MCLLAACHVVSLGCKRESSRPNAAFRAYEDASPRLASAADSAPMFADPTPRLGGGLHDPLWRKGPIGHVTVGASEVSGGTVANADRVVAGLRAGFRACYNRAIGISPAQKGSLRIVARLNEQGAVTQARAEGGRGLAPETIDCIVRRVQSASFSAPEGSNVVVAIPLTLELAEEE